MEVGNVGAHAQQESLDRYQTAALSRFVDVPAVGGRAHVLVVGEGPPVVMVIGGGAPAVSWAPLMAQLDGFTLYAVDRPGFGLTDTTPGSSGADFVPGSRDAWSGYPFGNQFDADVATRFAYQAFHTGDRAGDRLHVFTLKLHFQGALDRSHGSFHSALLGSTT